MNRLMFLLLVSLLFPGSLHAQNLTIGCGVSDANELAEFASLFTSDDPTAVQFRGENNLQRVGPTEIVAIPDSATCERLAERAAVLLEINAAGRWSGAEWFTYAIRVGPYYYIYIAELLPPGWVGGGSYRFVLDAVTLKEIPTPYDFQ